MEEPQEEPKSMPAWVMTFADLMSLLMCFFVLLLSFAEIDAIKFRQIAQSLEQAFGVQREVPAVEPPMGTSIIFDQFSPGIPRPTPLEEVRQDTSQEDPNLRTFTADLETLRAIEQQVEQQVEQTVEQVRQELETELEQGMMQLETGPQRIVIRIEERGSFGSGSADLNPRFKEMINKVGDALARIPGEISVEGHTDNIPIRTARFFSNWDLSAARAAAVANALIENELLPAERLRIQGHADTRPLVNNDTTEDRAKNRRVEIVIDLAEPIDEYERAIQDLIEAGRMEDIGRLRLGQNAEALSSEGVPVEAPSIPQTSTGQAAPAAQIPATPAQNGSGSAD